MKHQVVARFSATLAPNHECRPGIKALGYFKMKKYLRRRLKIRVGEIFYPVSNMCSEISTCHIGKTNEQRETIFDPVPLIGGCCFEHCLETPDGAFVAQRWRLAGDARGEGDLNVSPVVRARLALDDVLGLEPIHNSRDCAVAQLQLSAQVA
jgi:hypothetical protein